MDIFYDLCQDGRIADAHRTAARAESGADRAEEERRRLEERFDRLGLITRALWELLAERHGLEEAALADKVEEIDLRDGRLDGRLRLAPSDCRACGRRIHPRHQRCLYCGQDMTPGSIFDRT